jgi:hypothetical protein
MNVSSMSMSSSHYHHGTLLRLSHRRRVPVSDRPCPGLRHAAVRSVLVGLPWMRAKPTVPPAGCALTGNITPPPCGHGCGRQRKEGGGSDMWAQHVGPHQHPVNLPRRRFNKGDSDSVLCEPINRFRDPVVHF